MGRSIDAGEPRPKPQLVTDAIHQQHSLLHRHGKACNVGLAIPTDTELCGWTKKMPNELDLAALKAKAQLKDRYAKQLHQTQHSWHRDWQH